MVGALSHHRHGGLCLLGYEYHLWHSTVSKIHTTESANDAQLIKQRKPFSVLAMGTDVGALGRGTSYAGNTDTMEVITVNPQQKRITMVAIPRDTLVKVTTKEGTKYVKINAAYAIGGPQLVKKQVSELIDVPIDFYALTNMGTLKTVVNAVGGVDVNNPFALMLTTPLPLCTKNTISKRAGNTLMVKMPLSIPGCVTMTLIMTMVGKDGGNRFFIRSSNHLSNGAHCKQPMRLSPPLKMGSGPTSPLTTFPASTLTTTQQWIRLARTTSRVRMPKSTEPTFRLPRLVRLIEFHESAASRWTYRSTTWLITKPG